MSKPIIYVDQSNVREGKFEALKEAMDELIEFIDANEPRLIAYDVYFSEDQTRMTVVHIHFDSESLAFHMEVAGHLFPKFAEFVQIQTVDIYGEPDEALVKRLQEKARMLGNGTVRIHGRYGGLDRFS
ncbi:MAG: hypothetical protein ACOC9C_00700 [Chloroflexota bacterium]